MSVIDNFDINVNFWTLYPQMLNIGVFEKFHRKDRTKDKNYSSQIMWAIALLLDRNKNNNFRNLPEEEKKVQLAKYFIKEKDFDWDSIKELTEGYHNLILSQAVRSLIAWDKKMRERDEFIDKTTYDASSYEMLDKMMSATYKMYQQYDAIKSQLNLEQDTDESSKKQYITEI